MGRCSAFTDGNSSVVHAFTVRCNECGQDVRYCVDSHALLAAGDVAAVLFSAEELLREQYAAQALSLHHQAICEFIHWRNDARLYLQVPDV
jgi:hypothetical protein